jgi:VWFA-related protein
MNTKALSVAFISGLWLFVLVVSSEAQQQPIKPNQDNDVVRVNTNLVLTDVMVFDKQGKFVDGLKREQFELKVDGKAHPISFFELIKAGSANEDSKLAAARGVARGPATPEQKQTILLDRGRMLFLYVDDLHLSPESMKRMREMLFRFIDREVGQNDEVEIITPSGQLGFLQQLTDNKDVLRRAVNKLQPRPYGVKDLDRPPMSEHQAISIERYDPDVVNYFVDRIIAENPGLRRDTAEAMVHSRARNMLQQASNYTTATLNGLESMIKSLAQLPGRKLVFFVSDGFLIDDRIGDVPQRLRQVTAQAARANVVIYSLDARGLISGLPEASSDAAFDPTGRLARAGGGEVAASQDALYSLARDTGGRALLNNNSADMLVKKVLEETSVYYLLAWTSDDEFIQKEKFGKIEVNVIGRPDLVVRTRRGFLAQEVKETPKRNSDKKKHDKNQSEAKSASNDLMAALKNTFPLTKLPTAISASFIDIPQTGTLLNASIEIQSEALTFEMVNNILTATLDIVGVIVNEEGKPVRTFQDRWTIAAPKDYEKLKERKINNTYQAKMEPGLYQVRIATRETKNGRVGNASTWIEIPDLKTKTFSVGSLFIGERKPVESESANNHPTPPEQMVEVNVPRRFSNYSYLRFLTHIYNSSMQTQGRSVPDVVLQVQIFRDDQPVLTAELVKVQTAANTDMMRIPYAAELPLQNMPAGRYSLQVTAIDRVAKKSASQRINFTIE